MTRSVSVVIPTLNAADGVDALLGAIKGQAYAGTVEILVIDSESNDGTVERVRQHPSVRVHPIPRRTFNHGATRNLGVRETTGELVVFLSQDALPANPRWLASLVAAFDEDDRIAAAFSRQVPRADAPPMEQFFLAVHFPDTPHVQQVTPGSGKLGLRDVFFSNVSSAVRRQAIVQFPFREDLIMSEDQQLSRDLLQAGFRIAYQPASVVLHSHRYTLKSAFQRYFDSAYSLTCILDQSIGESFGIGATYVPREFWHVLTRHGLWIPYYLCYLVAKTAGSIAGHLASHLPRPWARRLSLHKGFWDALGDRESSFSETPRQH